MACQDCNKKTITNKVTKKGTVLESLFPPTYKEIVWEGPLSDYLSYIENERNIVKIIRDKNKYIALIFE